MTSFRVMKLLFYEFLNFRLAFISSSQTHDSLFVYCVIKKLMPIVRRVVADLTNVHYFTDGASAQYKNEKVFINLLYHMEDFGCTATHHLYVTSHGKGPIDGIGGRLKGLYTIP